MSYSRLLVEQRSSTAIITLHEPEKRNPFSPVLIDELIDSLTSFSSNDEVVTVIFTGSGTAFSSGADLRVIGRKAANELLLTGRPITASEAWRLGLVNRVVQDGEALAAALELATAVARNTAHGLAFTKDVVRTTMDMEYNKALDYARDIRVISRLHPAFQGRMDNYLSGPEQRK